MTTEREFLGLDDVIAKATERSKASETAADELVRLYEALRTWLPSIVTGDTARAAEAWREVR